MNLTKDLQAKFEKLGVNSWCELALNIPHSYEDLTLHPTIQMGKPQLVDATVESVFRAPNTIQITFFAHNLGHTISGVLFRPKPYMMHQFKVGDRDYFYGVIDCKTGNCSMTMPRKTTTVGAITPKYKSALRGDVMLRLIQNNLTLEKLLSEGLKEEIAKEVLKLHFPAEHLINLKELDTKTIDALKYLELFSYMKQLSAKRRYFEPIVSVDASYEAWSQTLPFQLTNEQVEAIEDIKNDLKKNVASRRMIVGDVGSGKTMVILASASMMFPHRSILMAPTTILANQLFEEAQKFLPDAKIVLVSVLMHFYIENSQMQDL
jgi:ATP-dependent DNA helicase RecG